MTIVGQPVQGEKDLIVVAVITVLLFHAEILYVVPLIKGFS